LNHYYIQTGTWAEGQPALIDTRAVATPRAKRVVVHETAHSGHVLITRSGEGGGSHGHHPGGHDLSVNVHSGPTTVVVTDTQIYVNVISEDDSQAAIIISAPLRTSLEFYDVAVLELHIVFQVGPPGWKKADYSTLVNAHVVYEEFDH
jgi:hypothetical protein